MFTLFSTPKPFRGEFARIQRNAMRSWVALRPRPEILIFGDEEGTAGDAEAQQARAAHRPTGGDAASGDAATR